MERSSAYLEDQPRPHKPSAEQSTVWMTRLESLAHRVRKFGAPKLSDWPATDQMYLHHGATMRWEDVTCNDSTAHRNPGAITIEMEEQVPRTAILPPIDHMVGEVLWETLNACQPYT